MADIIGLHVEFDGESPLSLPKIHGPVCMINGILDAFIAAYPSKWNQEVLDQSPNAAEGATVRRFTDDRDGKVRFVESCISDYVNDITRAHARKLGREAGEAQANLQIEQLESAKQVVESV